MSEYVCALICNVFFFCLGGGPFTKELDIDQPSPTPSQRLTLAAKERGVVDATILSPLSHAEPRNTVL